MTERVNIKFTVDVRNEDDSPFMDGVLNYHGVGRERLVEIEEKVMGGFGALVEAEAQRVGPVTVKRSRDYER